tara:strand:- start:247 stop:1203 length:957 start_codon:yes stop_codon:yes gene_type:complete
MSKILIRQANVEDSNAIIKLLNKEWSHHWWSKENPKDFWVWNNENLSHRESIVSVATYNNDIIGHYCILPKLLKINNTLIESGIGILATVDSDFRNDVSIMDISKFAYEKAQESGMKMIYGFPNDNYYLIQEKLERWDKVHRYKSKEINISKKFETSFKLEELSNSHTIFDNVKVDEMISIHKDSNYCYNRYIKHPRDIYKSFLIYKDNDVVGFLVTKIFNSSKGHIIDFIINGEIECDDIIKLANNYFLENDVTDLSYWPTSETFTNSLNKIYDTINDGFNTNFYVKFLDDSFKTKYKDKITNINNWNLPMGVSDVF